MAGRQAVVFNFFCFSYNLQDHSSGEESAAAHSNRSRSARCSRQLCSQRIQRLEPPGTSVCRSWTLKLLVLFLSIVIWCLLPLGLFPVEDTVPGYRLPFSFYGLQTAAPAQCRIHLGVPLQIIGPGHVHLQSAVQSGGRTCEHTPSLNVLHNFTMY